MQHSYDLFSSCYRELIKATGHLQNELQLVDELIDNFNICKHASILDAACGTGDLLRHLYDNGYTNLSGRDMSLGMLARAKEILPEKMLSCTRWDQMFEQHRYDLILVLSVSLLHASSKTSTLF